MYVVALNQNLIAAMYSSIKQWPKTERSWFTHCQRKCRNCIPLQDTMNTSHWLFCLLRFNIVHYTLLLLLLFRILLVVLLYTNVWFMSEHLNKIKMCYGERYASTPRRRTVLHEWMNLIQCENAKFVLT